MALTGYNKEPGRFIPDFRLKEPQPHPRFPDVKYIPWAYVNAQGLDVPGGCDACPFTEATQERKGSDCYLSACDMGVYVSTASLVAYRMTR